MTPAETQAAYTRLRADLHQALGLTDDVRDEVLVEMARSARAFARASEALRKALGAGTLERVVDLAVTRLRAADRLVGALRPGPNIEAEIRALGTLRTDLGLPAETPFMLVSHAVSALTRERAELVRLLEEEGIPFVSAGPWWSVRLLIERLRAARGGP